VFEACSKGMHVHHACHFAAEFSSCGPTPGRALAYVRKERLASERQHWPASQAHFR
jgi:hypothetical protein